MNMIKPKNRARLGPEMLDALLRIKMHDSTVKTLDVKRLVHHYLLHHRSCDKNTGINSGLRRLPDGADIDEGNIPMETNQASESSSSNESDSSSSSDASDSSTDDESDSSSSDDESESEQEEEHGYSFNPNRIITKDEDDMEFVIFNDWKGHVLTVVHDKVYTRPYNKLSIQRWFRYEEAIISTNGKALQMNGKDKLVSLEPYNPNAPGQKWDLVLHGTSLSHELISVDGLRLDLIGNLGPLQTTVNVGGKAKANQYNHLTQLWKLQYMSNDDIRNEREE